MSEGPRVSPGKMWVGPPGTPPDLTDPGWTYLGETNPGQWVAHAGPPRDPGSDHVSGLRWDDPGARPLDDIRRIHDAGRPSYATGGVVGGLAAATVTITTRLRRVQVEDFLLRIQGIDPPKRGGRYWHCGYTFGPPGGKPVKCKHRARLFPDWPSRYRRHWRRWHGAS